MNSFSNNLEEIQDVLMNYSNQIPMNSNQIPMNSNQIPINLNNQIPINLNNQIPINSTIKKISMFTKMSNHVAKRPKFHLVLIILLILLIIIILIYYRGLLFIGPFCQTTDTKDKEKTKPEDDLITEKLIKSINK